MKAPETFTPEIKARFPNGINALEVAALVIKLENALQHGVTIGGKPMTLFQALNVIAECEKAEREERPNCHCIYGHIDCSFKPNGPCFDEACTVVEAHEQANEQEG